LEHFESTPILIALIIVTYVILDPYLDLEKRCAATELLLFAGSVYVETLFIIQNTEYSDDLLYALLLLAFLMETYTNIFSKGREYDNKLTTVTLILIVAWVVSWLCVPRLQEHGFSAMWVSKNWHRKLGFLQDCMVATYAHYTHTVPQNVKTIFLKRQFITKWFETIFWGAAGVVIALLVSIWVVERVREISTEDKNKIETHEATIQERDRISTEDKNKIETHKATIQERDRTIQELISSEQKLNDLAEPLYTDWKQIREDKRVLTERNAMLETKLAEAVADKSINEAAEAAARVSEP